MDPLTKAYMQIINESDEGTVKTNLKVGAAFGDKDNEKNASTFIKGSGPDDVDDLESPDEAPKELTSNVDSSLKKAPSIKGESRNPFDALFNKIVSEETFDFSTEDENEIDSSNAFEDNTMDDGDAEEEDLEEFDDSEEDSSEEVTLTLDKELASKLIEVLQAALGEEGEDEEGEEEGEEGEDESEYEGEEEADDEEGGMEEYESMTKESHALDGLKPLADGVKKLTNPKSHKVEGTLSKVKGGSAKVPSTGKGSNKPMKQHNTKPAVNALTKKKQDVKGSSLKKGDEYFK
jgi:hypothetical protein